MTQRINKKNKERLITATRNNSDSTRTNKTKIGMKNNCIAISSDKQAKSHSRRLEHGKEGKPLEKHKTTP